MMSSLLQKGLSPPKKKRVDEYLNEIRSHKTQKKQSRSKMMMDYSEEDKEALREELLSVIKRRKPKTNK